MIAAEHKYYEILKILLTKSQDTNLDFNIRCPEGKTAFIYACIPNENEGQEESIRLFLEHAEENEIDIKAKDKADKSGFDYLSSDLLDQLANEFPQFFQD